MGFDLLQLLRFGVRTCPHCGAANLRRSRYCQACDERIGGGNLIVRFVVTVIALGVVGLAVWWQLR